MRKLLALLMLLSFAPQALAWGREGHQIISELAQRRLTPTALAEVQRLLALEQQSRLADIANWADDQRGSDPNLAKKTARWHYVNFPRDDCSFAPARDCPDGNCVVAAINRYFLVLGDRKRPDAERLEALKYLVHFVGDAHQPMHAGFADDRGGNDFQVNLNGEGSNLHQVWDRKILQAHQGEFLAYADELDKRSALPFDPSGRSDRPAVDWAQESCKIVAGKNFYPPGHTLDPAYLERNRALAELRLRQAGARLAAMLNYALAPPAKP